MVMHGERPAKQCEPRRGNAAFPKSARTLIVPVNRTQMMFEALPKGLQTWLVAGWVLRAEMDPIDRTAAIALEASINQIMCNGGQVS